MTMFLQLDVYINMFIYIYRKHRHISRTFLPKTLLKIGSAAYMQEHLEKKSVIFHESSPKHQNKVKTAPRYLRELPW